MTSYCPILTVPFRCLITFFSALTLFEYSMVTCDQLLSNPDRALQMFDVALTEAQSVVMETSGDKDDMVRLSLYFPNV